MRNSSSPPSPAIGEAHRGRVPTAKARPKRRLLQEHQHARWGLFVCVILGAIATIAARGSEEEKERPAKEASGNSGEATEVVETSEDIVRRNSRTIKSMKLERVFAELERKKEFQKQKAENCGKSSTPASEVLTSGCGKEERALRQYQAVIDLVKRLRNHQESKVDQNFHANYETLGPNLFVMAFAAYVNHFIVNKEKFLGDSARARLPLFLTLLSPNKDGAFKAFDSFCGSTARGDKLLPQYARKRIFEWGNELSLHCMKLEYFLRIIQLYIENHFLEVRGWMSLKYKPYLPLDPGDGTAYERLKSVLESEGFEFKDGKIEKLTDPDKSTGKETDTLISKGYNSADPPKTDQPERRVFWENQLVATFDSIFPDYRSVYHLFESLFNLQVKADEALLILIGNPSGFSAGWRWAILVDGRTEPAMTKKVEKAIKKHDKKCSGKRPAERCGATKNAMDGAGERVENFKKTLKAYGEEAQIEEMERKPLGALLGLRESFFTLFTKKAEEEGHFYDMIFFFEILHNVYGIDKSLKTILDLYREHARMKKHGFKRAVVSSLKSLIPASIEALGKKYRRSKYNPLMKEALWNGLSETSKLLLSEWKFDTIVHPRAFHLINQMAFLYKNGDGSKWEEGGFSSHMDTLLTHWAKKGLSSDEKEINIEHAAQNAETKLSGKVLQFPSTEKVMSRTASVMASFCQRWLQLPHARELKKVDPRDATLVLMEDTKALLEKHGSDLEVLSAVVPPSRTRKGKRPLVKKLARKLLRMSSYSAKHANMAGIRGGLEEAESVIYDVHKVFMTNRTAFENEESLALAFNAMVDDIQRSYHSGRRSSHRVPENALYPNLDPEYGAMAEEDRAEERRVAVASTFLAQFWKQRYGLFYPTFARVHLMKNQDSRLPWVESVTSRHVFRVLLISSNLLMNFLDKMISPELKKLFKQVDYGAAAVATFTAYSAGKIYTHRKLDGMGYFLTSDAFVLGVAIKEWNAKRKADRIKTIIAAVGLLVWIGVLVSQVAAAASSVTPTDAVPPPQPTPTTPTGGGGELNASGEAVKGCCNMFCLDCMKPPPAPTPSPPTPSPEGVVPVPDGSPWVMALQILVKIAVFASISIFGGPIAMFVVSLVLENKKIEMLQWLIVEGVKSAARRLARSKWVKALGRKFTLKRLPKETAKLESAFRDAAERESKTSGKGSPSGSASQGGLYEASDQMALLRWGEGFRAAAGKF